MQPIFKSFVLSLFYKVSDYCNIAFQILMLNYLKPQAAICINY